LWIPFSLSSVDDVYATCEKLEKAGCSFKKKPDEGRMKGLAFVYDPGMWSDLQQRQASSCASWSFYSYRFSLFAAVFGVDSYWVEIVKRGENSGIKNELNFSQTMLRVKVRYTCSGCLESLWSLLNCISTLVPPIHVSGSQKVVGILQATGDESIVRTTF
jgi:hypothetical protein